MPEIRRDPRIAAQERLDLREWDAVLPTLRQVSIVPVEARERFMHGMMLHECLYK
jgi:hypothetical protein